MRSASAALPCAASEPAGMRFVRRCASWSAVLSAALVALASAKNLFGVRADPGPAASVAFAVASFALVAASVASVRHCRRFPILALSLVTVVALAFTGLGRGTSGLTLPTVGGGRDYAAVGLPLILCLASVVLANQVAFWLTRRNACACE